MNTPTSGRIADLVRDLSARGLDVGELASLQEQLDAVEHPPGWFARMRSGFREFADRQWRNVWGELQESADVAAILRRAMSGETVSAIERDKVRSQILDLLRVAPAGFVALAVEAIPVPGTSAVTPWLLTKLGLMPSRWREAHLLHRLQKESARLRAADFGAEADEVDLLAATITRECDEREELALDAALLSWWDADKDGQWDPEERIAYDAAVGVLRTAVKLHGHTRRWYLCDRKHVFGPLRLSELGESPTGGHLMVRFDVVEGWVSLADVLDVDPDTQAAPTVSVAL